MSKTAKEKKNILELDFEATQNLVGFFELLLEVDRRINPHYYKKKYDRHGNSTDSKTPASNK